jgi:uncharacterized repeat protein (TIGR01451 family)
MAQAATADGALRVEVITAYNLVVDSNAGTPASYAPRSAYIGATFHNDGSVPLTGIAAHIGNYTNGAASSTPGIYPARVHPGLTGPLAGGAFAFTHEGGSAGLADATRAISEIPAGGSVTVYWLISYPQTDIYNVPCWGSSVKPDDDLWLEYDVWATATEAGTPRAVDVTRTFTFRNEISASANKIFPNGANKVPTYYKELLNQYVPSWTNANYDGSVGTLISTDGIWYDFGNVGEGFDNNGDLVPDHNAWMQPVGDPSLFDPSAFRLVRTYAFVIVKLKTGGEAILSGQDQLYFENIPENNGAVGYVRYQYMPLRPGASSVTTPYQEVASGRDNEKFNADYGVSLGEQLISGEAKVGLDKTVDKAVAYPSDTLSYTVSYSNTGTVEVGNAQLGIPLVVQDAIPAGTTYVGGTAAAGNTLPSGVDSYQLFYSTDGGNTWTNAQPSPASAVTHLQWWLSDPLLAGEGGSITFAVTVNSPYTRTSPIIPNTAGLSFGNTPPFITDDAETRVLGDNSVGDTVFADTGVGAGGYLANGIQDGAEPGIPDITVWLYADANANGVVDPGEPLVATTNTAANGTYLFDQLADGRYVVVVDATDPQMPAGYTSTTAERVAVDLDSGRANSEPVSVLTADFGFAPALVLTKRVEGSATRYEGDLVTFTITVTNNMPGDGTGVGKPAKYRLWAKSGTTGTQQKAWQTPANAYNVVEPDGLYAVAPMRAADEWLNLSSLSIGPQLGDIASVRVVVPIRVTQPFDTTDSLDITVQDNGTAIGGATLSTNANLLAVGTYEISFDITAARAWTWASFAPGNTLSIYFLSGGKPSAAGVVEVDAAAFELTSTATTGATGGTTTLDPVPLDDVYATNRLSYVSSVPPANSVTNSGATGVLHWDNLGPIYPGGGRIVSVTFRALEPPDNTTATTTNTASVTEAFFLNGRPANDDEDQAGVNVLPSGTIGDTVWRDLDAGGDQDAGEPGIPGVTVRLYTNGVLLATTTTDATGYYLFAGLTNSATYIVAVDPATLPGGSGTPTYDRDGTATPNVASNIVLNVASTNGLDTVLDADFGYTLASLIRGTIWHDRDRGAESAPESGEELLGGVTVRLYNGDNQLVATTTTAADGTYLFVGAGVTNGTYTIRVDAAAAPLGSSWTASYDTDTLSSLNEVEVVLPPGGERIADYSYYLTGSAAIGDTLFYDWNGDGVQSNGVDTGIANIAVRLYRDANTNGVVDAASDALVATTVTATNGWYLFSGLPADAYIVIVDQADPDFPSLYLNTYDPFGAKDGVSALTVGVATNLLQDFGYQPYGFNSIGDTVWRDLNADGVQSGASETGISNVTVRLLADFNGDGSYTLVQTAVTDAAGKYLFTSLPDGDYRVEVVTASPGLPTDSFGYPYRPTTVAFYETAVSGGAADLDNDFGFAPLGGIGDTLFWDGNVNGDQDWNEPGIPGVRVELYLDENNNDVYDAGETQYGTNVWTDARGKYLFTGLPPGEYVVRVDPTSEPLVGATLSADPEMDGEPCPDPLVPGPTCDAATDVTILPGTSFMGADFGYRSPLGVLGDLLWIDLNANGVFDAGERGIPYVTVELYSGDSLVETNVTDASGFYLFSNLSNGTYRVTVLTNDTDFPLGLTATYDADGTSDSTTGEIDIDGGHVVSINGVGVTDADLMIDFGYRFVGSNRLSGTVGLDVPTFDGLLNGMNPNGVGTGEYPFAGRTVYLSLWNDAGVSNVVESGETTPIASVTTLANGDYSFENLPAGDGDDRYIVKLAAPAVDLRLTTETGDTTALWVRNTTNAVGASLSASQAMTIIPSRDNIDFAYEPTRVRDFGDLPVTYSTTVADRPVGPSHTQIAGRPLWLGQRVETENNGRPTPDATGDGDEEDGVVAVGRWTDGGNSGHVEVTVGAGSGWLVAWVDFNRDGTFTNANERVVNKAVDSGGTGTVYALSFPIPEGTFRTDGATVLNARFRLYESEPLIALFAGDVVGGEVEDYQFVFGIVGNLVWEDMNGNGVQDAGEPGVSNVVVRLYDASGLEITNATTAADGSYAFTGLPVTNYSLTFEPPSDTFFTAESAGGDAQLDSDANLTSGESGTVSLLGSADRRDIDAGLYVPAAVFGHLFVDKDGDLVRDTGDSSVTNALVWLAVNGVTVASTNTSDIGYYFFGDVPPGTVSILVSRASATLIDVPTTDPALSDERRNRAEELPDDEAYIAYPVTSGYGVLSTRPGEPLNFGFVSYPLSTALDISLYASGDAVTIEIWTVNESGQADIVIYAWIGNEWVEVGRVPGSEVWGDGSNRYQVQASGLTPGASYNFKIVDEAGHVHVSAGPLEVKTIRMEAVRLNMETMAVAFNTEPGRRYTVLASTDLVNWTPEFVSRRTTSGWSAFTDQPFTAGASRTEVLIPVNARAKAFFKVMMLQE